MDEKLTSPHTRQQELHRLRQENESLRAELAEAKETLDAIQTGAVDALVVHTSEGERIFTLEGAEHSYRSLIEQMEEGAVTLTSDGIIHYCNRGFANMLKRPLEQIMGTPVGRFLAEGTAPCFEALLRQGLAGGARGEVVFQASDGSPVPAQVGLAPLVDHGSAASASMVVIDLSERKRAENVLASAEFIRRLINSAPIGVAVVGRDLRYILANAAYQAIADDPAAPITGRTVAEVFPPDIARILEPPIQQVLQSGQPLDLREVETPIHGQSWWNVTKVPLRDAQGKNEAVLILTEDVTERKRAEERLRESEERFRTMGNAISQLVWIANADGFIHWYNRRWYEYTGTTPQEMEGWGWQKVHDPQTLPMVLTKWKTSIATGEQFDMIFPLRGADGRFRPFLTRAEPLKDERGRVMQWFGTNTDVSEQKAAQEALAAAKVSAERARAEAEAANRAKDDFLATLSHELRTPLAPVVTAVAVLQEDPRFDADTRRDLEMIRRNVEMEARLIDDLLDVTRIERGKIELDRRPTELDSVIRQAVEVCAPEIAARKLEFGIDTSGGPYPVEADAARLQQVFWNLIKNAIKFTPPGGCVGIRCRRDGDGFAVAQVTDSGEGIDPEVLPRLFSAFEQGGRKTTRQFGGLGLGLTISRALMELHGGTIQAHSEGKGKGATFTVRLPLTAHTSHQTAGNVEHGHPPGSSSAPLRILLVEDHADTARIMRRLLSAHGHEVHPAGDVATALKLAEEQEFDLLLSDLGLPDGSGLDLMRKLRAKGIAMPGIALSGYGQEKDIEQSRNVGFVAHLVKPVSMRRLQDAIAKVVAQGLPVQSG